MPFQAPMETVKVVYFYELGMTDIESKIILRQSLSLLLSRFEIKNLGSGTPGTFRLTNVTNAGIILSFVLFSSIG